MRLISILTQFKTTPRDTSVTYQTIKFIHIKFKATIQSLNLDEDFIKIVTYFETKCAAGPDDVLTLQVLNHTEKSDIALTEVNRSKLTVKKESYLQWTTFEETISNEINLLK